MKAICKRAFTAGGRDYKPGDEVECTDRQFDQWDWHGYVVLPENMPENKTEDAADEGGSKGADEISQGDDSPESPEPSSEEEASALEVGPEETFRS